VGVPNFLHAPLESVAITFKWCLILPAVERRFLLQKAMGDRGTRPGGGSPRDFLHHRIETMPSASDFIMGGAHAN
jgi:hypothetical protein